MSKTLIVMWHEFLTMLRKPTFWIGIFVVPLITGIIVLVIFITSGAALAVTVAQRNAAAQVPKGVVDLSGILAQSPQALSTQPNLRTYRTEADARAALEHNDIDGIFIVEADYVGSGNIRYISRQFSPFEDLNRTESFRNVLKLALLKGDTGLLKRIDDPVEITARTALSPQQTRSPLGGDFSPVPFAIGMIFFITLISAGSYLMQTVTTEKENRVMEVLMSSVSPIQLLAGKIAGLGLLGSVQLFTWLLSLTSLVQAVPMIEQYVGPLPVTALAWAALFFVGGYVIYACMMAGLGALMPGGREAGQYMFFLMIPLLIPMWLNSAIMSDINGPLATTLSFFPLTSSVVMPMRLVEGSVPIWQILLSLLILIVAAVGTLWLVARAFRAQALLSGSRPSLKDVVVLLARG